MKVLFVIRHPMYLRNYESTIRLLLDRGHRVHVGYTKAADRFGVDESRLPRILSDQYQHFTFAVAPCRKDLWGDALEQIRTCRDYLFYLHPSRLSHVKLRQRVEKHVPPMLRKLAQWSGGLRLRNAMERLLTFFEKIAPIDPAIQKYLRAAKGDVVVVSPLIDVKSRQIDYVKAARVLGLPCVYGVASWDNLTTKGKLQVSPHRILLWNEFQRREAIEMHGVDPAAVVVTGAQLFDQWFEQQPSTTGEEFRRKVGLPSEKPILLYLCSSGFIAGDEAGFVRRWIHAVRESADPMLREASVLVRPHPANIVSWQDVDLSDCGAAAIWPRKGATPIDADSRSDYFDSLHHSAAVVGVNTSALFEAGVVGRRSFTILAPEFAQTQTSVPHFEHLLRDGFLVADSSLPEHCRSLARELRRPTGKDPNVREYLEAFLRPRGLDLPCTPVVAQAIEDAADLAPAQEPLSAALLPFQWTTTFALRLSALAALATNAPVKRLKKIKKLLRPDGIRALLVGAVRKLHRLPGDCSRQVHGMRRDLRIAHTRLAEERSARRIQERIPAVLKGDSQLLVVGPWMSEVGFELLYWIPFLRRQLTRFRVDPQNVLVISRGNAFSWYQPFAGKYVDIFDLHTPQEFYDANRQREMQQHNGKKHLKMCDFERELVVRALRRIGGDSRRSLHPSVMYNLYGQFWKGVASEKLVMSHSDFSTCPQIPPRPVQLPFAGDYVAVKLYFSSCLPHTPENVRFAQNLIHRLAERQPVVLLNTGLKVDDHGELTEGLGLGNVVDATTWMTPRDNLALQTAVVANASRLYCTYGGFSYLGPMHNVDTVAIYSEANFKMCHLSLATRVLNESRSQSFALMSTWALERLLDENSLHGAARRIHAA